jgi:hypothetical protein
VTSWAATRVRLADTTDAIVSPDLPEEIVLAMSDIDIAGAARDSTSKPRGLSNGDSPLVLRGQLLFPGLSAQDGGF